MQTITDDAGATMHYSDRGEGRFVLALHGAYSTHHEIEAALEPIFAMTAAHRRLYPDLTGMGDSPAHATIRTTADLVDLVEALIDQVVGDAQLLVAGHSYGALVARAIAARRPVQVAGLVLICPMLPDAMHAEPHVVVREQDGAIELIEPALRDDFAGYFVEHTPATAERFNAAVAPALGRFDADPVGAMMAEWAVEPDPDDTAFDHPTLIACGRSDSITGYRGALELASRSPHTTFVAVAGAGHALPHERPELLAALVHDWLRDVDDVR